MSHLTATGPWWYIGAAPRSWRGTCRTCRSRVHHSSSSALHRAARRLRSTGVEGQTTMPPAPPSRGRSVGRTSRDRDHRLHHGALRGHPEEARRWAQLHADRRPQGDGERHGHRRGRVHEEGPARRGDQGRPVGWPVGWPVGGPHGHPHRAAGARSSATGRARSAAAAAGRPARRAARPAARDQAGPAREPRQERQQDQRADQKRGQKQGQKQDQRHDQRSEKSDKQSDPKGSLGQQGQQQKQQDQKQQDQKQQDQKQDQKQGQRAGPAAAARGGHLQPQPPPSRS